MYKQLKFNIRMTLNNLMFELEAQAMLRWKKKKRNYSRLELMRYLTTAHTKQKTVMLNMFN